MFHWMNRVLALSAVTLMAACGGSDDDHPEPVNIVQTAQADPQFSILVEAVTAADLAATLSEPGPFTVFAPTNDAFAALLTELGITKEQLLADTALLTTVLTYHVLPAQVQRADIPLGKAITTVQGSIVKVDAAGEGLVITDGRNRVSGIVTADVSASNGVIHAIDKVLLPADKTIVDTAVSNADFSILVEAATAAGLVDTLNSAGPFTVFAPTNAAFASLLTELGITKAQLLADTALLTQVLTYHVIPARVLKAEITPDTPVATVQTDTLRIDSSFVITDQRNRTASIVAADILASNGVVHVIDKVILPAP